MNEFEKNIDALLEVIGSKPTTGSILLSLCTALLFSAVLWATYRLANTATTYQPKFGITLVVLAFISTVLMALIQSNLALSLGMLGSLSIVRFRTNIKDPRDIGFIFWSMSIGIAAATHSYFIGAMGSAVLAVFMIATRRKGTELIPMMLVVRGSSTDISRIQEVLDRMSGSSAVKAKNVLADSFELVYEVCLPEKEGDGMIDDLFGLGGIDSVNLLATNAQSV